MNNTRKTDGFVPFRGTVDELLTHMEKVDADQVQRVMVDETEDVMLSDDEAVALIKSESNVSDEEANVIISEVKRDVINAAIDNLVSIGYIELAGYDEAGQPEFGLTETGKRYVAYNQR